MTIEKAAASPPPDMMRALKELCRSDMHSLRSMGPAKCTFHIPRIVAFVAFVGLCTLVLDNHSALAHPARRDSHARETFPANKTATAPTGPHRTTRTLAKAVDPQIMEQTWSVQQGAPQEIQTMAQTTDGFLWLGGPGGLFRFDGSHFERFHAPSGDQLLSTNVMTLFAPPTGGLWVGYTFGGFSFVNNGQVVNYGGKVAASTGSIDSLAQDRYGVMWAGTASGVWRLEGPTWRQLGAEWDAPTVNSKLLFDRTGTAWVISGSENRNLLYLLPGGKRFQVAARNLGIADGFTLNAADGNVLTGPIAPKSSPRFSGPRDGLHAYPILGRGFGQIVDRANAVWTVDEGNRLTRIQASSPLKDAWAEANTKNSETYDVHPRAAVYAALLDREGNVWFADENGLHRFFYVPFSKQELPVKASAAMAADDNGAVWIAFWSFETSRKLYRVTKGNIETLNFHKTLDWTTAYRATDKTFWFGGSNGLWQVSHGTRHQMVLPGKVADLGSYLQTITQDQAGGLWVSFGRHGLYRLADGVWTSFGGRRDLPTTGVIVEFTDSLRRIWFGCTKNQLAVLDGDKVCAFGPGDGVRVGNVTAISGRGSGVWIGGEFGLQRFDGRRFQGIHAVDEDWLLGISGIVETAEGDLWLNGLSGIFHIGHAEVAEALKNAAYRVKGEHIGSREGLPGFAAQIRPLPTAIEGRDGRLWFSLSSGVVWIDPARARQQAIAAPVIIQSVSADDKNYEIDAPLTFPAHTSSVEIHYSAISLSDPEAIRTRVILRGTDADWHEVRTGDPVTYRNLGPGHYHFSAAASDTNGVWSNKIATVDFTILPAWYQTSWFRVFCICASLCLLWAIYQFRLKQLERQFHVAIDARVNERTRIARELHDTLLQSFNGLLLRFQTVSNLLPARPEEAKRRIDSVVEEGSNAITEGRDAVHELRSVGFMTVDLAQSIRTLAEELLGHSFSESAPEFQVHVEGTPTDLNPVVRDEAYRIAAESLRNSIRHAKAQRIEVVIRYDQEFLDLRIRDDGKGIDAGVLDKEHAPGHWGLRGMRERAKLIGATFDLWSKVGSGTEIELKIPGASAYAKHVASRRSLFWRSSQS